jgi:hypothetical protein
MGGLDALVYALALTVALMAALFGLSRLLMRFGILPLSAALSLSGFNSFLFYIIVFPGTVVHELSHYLACLLTGVRVHEVKLFSPQQDGAIGWVIHDRADPLRRSLIAIAPFIGGSVAIYVLMRVGLSTPLDPMALLPADLVQSLSSALLAALDTLRTADLHLIETWLILYALFSLGFGVAPSNEDLAPLFVDGLVAIGFILALKIADQQFMLGLAENSLLNSVGAALAGGVQHLNALLLFACAVEGLGTLFMVPVATLALWLRSSLRQ